MVCIYCGSDTKVTNSRPQKRSNQVWRRRECLNCRAVFTTEEVAQYSTAWAVHRGAHRPEPFSRDKLFLSIYHCLRHRDRQLNDAAGLTETVIAKLAGQTSQASLTNETIQRTVQIALNRFDKVASLQYQALHKKNH